MADLELGNVGTSLIMENEQVRVWQLVLEPGEASSWHQHSLDYLYVVIEPGIARTEYFDGIFEQEQEDFQGQVVIRTDRKIHRLVNLGNTRYINIVVELKIRQME